MTSKPILPGAVIGVLGSGQLGRMFAISARRMGYRVHTYSQDEDTPTGQVSDVEIQGSYDDLDAVRDFASKVDAVTFEFENVPAETAAAAASSAVVRPDGSVLHTTQHRLREKTFLTKAGIPVATFSPVCSEEELRQALARQGYPAILKSADFGYDGKGQFRIDSAEQIPQAWREVGASSAVLESLVLFEREVSVVAARGLDGSFVHYGVIENGHKRRILDLSVAPAAVSERTAKDAVDIARTILEQLDVIGVLCVEFFVLPDGSLLVNELAPRPHNSGHLTIDACVTSQFEQQLRAVCGLPFGSTQYETPAAMANLLGDLWADGEPNWVAACAFPNVKLHLYGKMSARAGRKMGHLTALGTDASRTAVAARQALLIR